MSRPRNFSAEDYETIRTVIESYVGLYFAVGDKNTTIARLRKMLFGAKTEKTAAVLGKAAERPGTAVPATDTPLASAMRRRNDRCGGPYGRSGG